MTSRLWLATLALLVVLGGCSTLVPVPGVPRVATAEAQAAWARVLDEYVNESGEVDFAALATRRADLDVFIRHVADTPLDSVPDGPQRLAYMINAYNALSMFNVIESGIPATHAGWKKLQFFVLRKFDIGSHQLSLYDFENEVIRPYTRALNDPRVHFALNCSAVACPVLPRRPFIAVELDAQLEREARAFFARQQNLRIDDATHTIWVSELMNFYPEDFVPRPAASLIDYISRYAPTPLPVDFALRFVPYDWTVANSRRPRQTP